MAVALVTNVESNSTSNTSPITGTQSIGAASTLLIVAVAPGVNSTSNYSGITATWSGVSMTAIATKVSSDNLSRVDLLGLVNPATGSHTLSISFIAATGSQPAMYFALVSWSGTDTSSVANAVPAANVLTDASTTTGTVYPNSAFAVTTVNGDAAMAIMNDNPTTFTSMNVGTLLSSDGALTGNFTDGYSLASGTTTNLQMGGGAASAPCCGIAIRIAQPSAGLTLNASSLIMMRKRLSGWRKRKSGLLIPEPAWVMREAA